ncbi:MAG: queuosine precursor transporter [Acidobacteria bacterium]|nr:queuosine precursor transporter [Acidobacteriota bacterium]
MAAFVTVLLCSGIIGVQKVSTIGPFSFGSLQVGPLHFGTAILFFPLSYVFGDILTEVYGYARSRRVIWAGFSALIFAAFMSWVVVKMPAAPGWGGQDAYEMIFGNTPRIVMASLLAFWAGEFANSFVLAKMKIFTSGRRLWTRTIGSTIVGEGVDSAIFYPLAFLGAPGWTKILVFQVMLSNYLLKVLWEILMTPFTYKIVNYLKRAENEDYYDRETNFNPFTLET